MHGIAVDPGLKARVKLRAATLLIEGRHIDGDVLASGSVYHHVGIPGIRTQDRGSYALRARSAANQRGIRQRAGSKDYLRAIHGSVRQVGGKVRVAGLEVLIHHHAAVLFKRLLKVVDQASIIVVAKLTQAVGNGRAQLFSGVIGQHRALEGIQEANAEIVGVSRRDAGVGAGNADGGNARLAKVGLAGVGDAGAVGAQHHRHVFAHQLLRGGRRLIRRRTVIGINKFHFIFRVAYFHGREQLVGILHAQHFLLAARAAVASGRLINADLDDFLAQRRSRDDHAQYQQDRQQFLHCPHLPRKELLSLYACALHFASPKLQNCIQIQRINIFSNLMVVMQG